MDVGADQRTSNWRWSPCRYSRGPGFGYGSDPTIFIDSSFPRKVSLNELQLVVSLSCRLNTIFSYFVFKPYRVSQNLLIMLSYYDAGRMPKSTVLVGSSYKKFT